MIELQNVMRAAKLMENATKNAWEFVCKEEGKPWHSLYIARLSADLRDKTDHLVLPWTTLKQLGTWVRNHKCEIWLKVNCERIDILIYNSSEEIEEIEGVQL